MSLDCSAESLAVTLTTDQPFTGRLFIQAGGSECQTRGTGRRLTALVVGYDQASAQRCGVERVSSQDYIVGEKSVEAQVFIKIVDTGDHSPDSD